MRSKDKQGPLLSLPSFGGGGQERSSFLVIDKNPRIGKDFRGCQMAVWSGLTGADLPADSCANVLQNAAEAVAGAVGDAAGKLAGGAGGLLGGGALGGGSRRPSTPQKPPQAPSGGLFGLGK